MPVEKPGHQGVWCSKCGYEFTSEPQGEPCPECGHTSRTYGVVSSTTAKAYPDMEAKAIPPGRGKSAYFLLIKTGYEFFRKTRRWHLRERLVDRKGKRYREYITDAETGEVIRDKDQRLDEHVAEHDLRKQNRSD